MWGLFLMNRFKIWKNDIQKRIIIRFMAFTCFILANGAVKRIIVRFLLLFYVFGVKLQVKANYNAH